MLMRVAVFPAEEQVAEVPEEVVQSGLLATLKATPGFAAAYFCIDPSSGKGLSVTLWETEDALRTSEASILRLSETEGARVPNPSSVETFEVRYTA
jgi:hypothetical protein